MTSPTGALQPLRPWQRAALAEWRGNDRRGIVAAATGTGKTRVALEALASLDATWVGIVVVPTKALQTQWVGLLSRHLGLHPRNIGQLGGDSPNLRVDHRVVVSVLNSARERLPGLAEHWETEGLRTLLVVDECHRAGARETAAGLLSVNYTSTLGLSATPERGDDGLDDILIPAIGPVVYRYPLIQALDDGLLSSLISVNMYLDLDDLSSGEYSEVERRIRMFLDQGVSADDPRVKRLRSDQQKVLRRAGGRTVALQSLTRGGLFSGKRSLIFHETIEQAETSADLMRDHGVRFALEHSKMTSDARATSLRRFATGAVDALVTVKALDEGIDVPEANVAVIFSGTMNPRQRIQRAGRIVRPSGGGSLLVSFLARGTTEEVEVGAKDAGLFGRGRVNHLAAWNPERPEATVAFIESLVT